MSFSPSATKTMFTQKRLLAEWEKMSGINYARRKRKEERRGPQKKEEKICKRFARGTKGLCNGGIAVCRAGPTKFLN